MDFCLYQEQNLKPVTRIKSGNGQAKETTSMSKFQVWCVELYMSSKLLEDAIKGYVGLYSNSYHCY